MIQHKMKLICKLLGHNWKPYANYENGFPPEQEVQCNNCELHQEIVEREEWPNFFSQNLLNLIDWLDKFYYTTKFKLMVRFLGEKELPF